MTSAGKFWVLAISALVGTLALAGCLSDSSGGEADDVGTGGTGASAGGGGEQTPLAGSGGTEAGSGGDAGGGGEVTAGEGGGDVGGEGGDAGGDAGTGGMEAGTGGSDPGGTGGSTTPIVVGRSLSALVEVDSCDEVLEELKKKTREETEQLVENNLQQALQMLQSGGYCIVYEVDMAGAAGSGGSAAPPPSTNTRSDEGGASEYSTTNVQVVGVDEADFVKNDGAYIYIIADGQFQIVDAWPAADAQVVSLVEIEGIPKKLYTYDTDGNLDNGAELAAIYSSLDPLQAGYVDPYPDMYRGGPSIMPMPGGVPEYQKECTYGYNCEFAGDGRALKITVLDIANKQSPALLRETEFSGSYLNSRRIDDVVHTVVTFPEISIPGIEYWPEEMQSYWNMCWEVQTAPFTEDEIRNMFKELNNQNADVIDQATITDFLPGIEDTRYVGGDPVVEEGLLDTCDNFYVSQAGDGRGFLALVSFEIDELGPLAATTIVGKPGAVYASHDSLYVAVRHYSSTMGRWYFDDPVRDPEATTFHKFSLSSETIATEYRGSGVAKGRILNQFSMDEHKAHLRAATTTGHVGSDETHNTLSVLAEQDGELVVVGMVDGLANREDIRSVRFNGDVGFVVTFEKTDPLFVFDLSEPTDPVVKGELHVDGFATYIHLMDDTHLLTMGYNAIDMGSFSYFQGIQLRVLDVSVLEEPTVAHEVTIGSRGSDSEAAINHLAFNYFPSRDLLAIPMTLCEESGSPGSYGERMTFGGLLVYRVTVEDGFEALGGVPHEEASSTLYPQYSSCGSWWTDSNSKVKRSIFMGMGDDASTFVYSIALDLINVSALSALDEPVASVELISAP